jgi:hypothetical protein
VEVTEPSGLLAYAYGGGWADGDWRLRFGTRILLTHLHKGLVFYRFPGVPPWDVGGGHFHRFEIGKLQRLDGRPLLVEREPPSGLLLAALEAMGVHWIVEIATKRGITIRVASREILVDLGDRGSGVRPGFPAYVEGIPVRYRIEDGQTFGTHGPQLPTDDLATQATEIERQ